MILTLVELSSLHYHFLNYSCLPFYFLLVCYSKRVFRHYALIYHHNERLHRIAFKFQPLSHFQTDCYPILKQRDLKHGL